MKSLILIIFLLFIVSSSAFASLTSNSDPTFIRQWDVTNVDFPSVIGGVVSWSPITNNGYNYNGTYAAYSQNANFLGGNTASGYFNYYFYTSVRLGFDYTNQNLSVIRDGFLVPTLNAVNVHTVKFNNISSKLAKIDSKIDSLPGGSNAMTTGDMAIVGSLLALIVAVTWRF